MDQTASEIFEALSRELRRLVEQTSRLQDQLSPHEFKTSDIETFQGMDSLHQTLECLANYAAHVAAVVPCACSVQIDAAADGVCLAAVASRLRGGAAEAIPVEVCEVELF